MSAFTELTELLNGVPPMDEEAERFPSVPMCPRRGCLSLRVEQVFASTDPGTGEPAEEEHGYRCLACGHIGSASEFED